MEILSTISTFSEYIIYLILFLGSLGDTLFPFSFFVHGELFFLSGGYLIASGKITLLYTCALLFIGAIIGDHFCYFIGKKHGKKIFKENAKILNTKNLKKAEIYFNKYGDKLILFSRFLGAVSWFTPLLAGTFGVRYLVFAIYNLIGVVLGISQFLIYGYLLFLGIDVLSTFSENSFIILAGIIFILLLLYFLKKKKVIINQNLH